MLFERKIYDDLVRWREKCNGTKALLIEGARGIGKTTVATDFARKEYKSFLLIDFSEVCDEVKRWFFELLDDTDDLFSRLSDYFHVHLYPRDSLIIFDEVQEFPRARECVKHLVEDGRYDYIETGSLISVRENIENILIPSEERSIRMYPMDFEEFCWALGENATIEEIKSCYLRRLPLDEKTHKTAMNLFYRYMLVGGMPRCVGAYVTGEIDMTAACQEKLDILNLYRNDILRSPFPYKSEVLNIYDNFSMHMSTHELVKYRNESKKAAGEAFEESYFWLADSMICNICFNCTNPELSLPLTEDRTFVKCYMADTGLLVSHAVKGNFVFESDLREQILNGNFSVDNGLIYENAIAQMLVSTGHRLYFYTHRKTKNVDDEMDIDFLIADRSKLDHKLCPVEVKTASTGIPKSLVLFKEKYGKRIDTSIVISPDNLYIKNDILNIPPYMAFCL